MNNYEAMLLIRPDLSEEERKELFAKLDKVISAQGGKIGKADIWADKKKLTYEIRTTLTSGGTRKYNEVLFYLINFHIDPEAIKQLRSDFKMSDSIIRSLIIKERKNNG